MSSGHYCDGCAQAYYKCVCNKPQEKVKEQTIKMNERIRQLAEQAKDWAYADHDGYTAQMLFEQKFAESVVMECTKILADNGELRGCVIIGKHFKVEE